MKDYTSRVADKLSDPEFRAISCVGKVAHPSYREAKKQLKYVNHNGTGIKIEAYQCPSCHAWHVGKNPRARKNRRIPYNRRYKHKGITSGKKY